ncbi:LysR family transcriptional regulator [Plesiomonas sp.]|uniref:LysR family transcriptional regulator n=1 Tax=Plesiomonas sp. TaxID=2486279 RepID=UPI003F40612B
MINPIWLKTFISLVDTGSFSRTAEKLNMTQPGVSQHINKLELHFEQALLHRIGKQFLLTDAGREVLIFAQQWLDHLMVLEQKLSFDDPYAGCCKIATPSSLGLVIFPKLMDWQALYPKLQISHEFAVNDKVREGVISQTFDWGLTTGRVDEEFLLQQEIGQEPLCLLLPNSVLFKGWDTLAQLGFINHPDGYVFADRLLGQNFTEYHAHTSLRASAYVNNINSILYPVAKGLGFTILPLYAWQRSVLQDQVQHVRLAVSVNEPIMLVTRSHKVLGIRHSILHEQVKTWIQRSI